MQEALNSIPSTSQTHPAWEVEAGRSRVQRGIDEFEANLVDMSPCQKREKKRKRNSDSAEHKLFDLCVE